ncbi:hypothetical protein ACTWPT_31450 [Nonomuraea sp. 3N208]|uniref:hypothetical protein n=1 Tax=Nonomuraea sp. 3N208 TaxID=3457421 RepID=UPI003FD3800B
MSSASQPASPTATGAGSGHSPDLNVEVVARDPVKDVRQLKTETGKGIQFVGGAEPAGALHHIKVNPVTAATGIPLVAGRTASAGAASP